MKNVHNIRGWVLALSVLITLISFSVCAEAQQSISSSIGVIVYPAKGQTAEQQNKDEGECYTWAKQQTGIDPVAVASAPAEAQEPAKGERVKGAARGAAAGAAVGAIAGDTDKDTENGAEAGAAVGVMAGGREKRKDKKEKEQQAEQGKTATLQQFNKGFAACMEGKGYTIK